MTAGIAVINSSKKADGSLPKAVDLNLEIEKFEKAKDEIERKNLVANAKLNRYKVIENNLKIILTAPKSKVIKNEELSKENSSNKYIE